MPELLIPPAIKETSVPRKVPVATPPAVATKPVRLVSLDAYRGFIMLAMASSLGAGLAVLANSDEVGHKEVWSFLAHQFDHVVWTGCVFWDLIQPSFMFMVGVAIPYSYASRKARGESDRRIFVHVLIRSLALVLLGIFLSSNGHRIDGQLHTNFTFVNVLTQIGLGYTFVFLLQGKAFWKQFLALFVILGSYWLYFYLRPLPPADFDYEAVKSSMDERFTGWFAHWDKNANAATAFDLWFLNLFPQEFKFNSGGYQTLNFIPSMATMLFGLMAGELLLSQRKSWQKLLWLLVTGGACLGVGYAANLYVCPSVKRIWTPSWAVFSSGWTFLMLAGFYFVIDIIGLKMWAFPLVVVGMNSIAMYCMAQLLRPWVKQTLQTHISANAYGKMFAGPWETFNLSLAILFVFWLVCLWLYRQKIFVRI